MEDDTCSFALSNTSSRSYQSALRSLSDLCLDVEEADGDNYYEEEDYDDEDLRGEFPCPFCSEDFDLIDLCHHIDDDHPNLSKPGICPVCGTLVGMNMVRHITSHHGNLFKRLQKLKFHEDESYSTLSRLKKELEDGYLSLLDVPPSVASSSNMESDLLLSFLYYEAPTDKSKSVQPHHLPSVTLEEKNSDESILQRDVHQPPPLSDKEQIEKTRRSQFVQGLLLSTIFDDDL